MCGSPAGSRTPTNSPFSERGNQRGLMRHIARALIGLAAVLILSWPVTAHSASGYDLSDFYVIPAVAHVEGLQGTFWRTDLSLVNPYTWRSITVTVKLLKSDLNNSSGPSRTFTLGPGQSLTLRDIGDQVFGFSGTGALVVWADEGVYFAATARTYTGAAGTFGQTEGGQQFVGVSGDVALIAGLRNDSEFRSNLGAVNASNVSLTLTVGIYNASGSLRGSKTVTLQPWSHTQFAVGTFTGNFTEGYARWTCQATTSRVQWVAYGWWLTTSPVTQYSSRSVMTIGTPSFSRSTTSQAGGGATSQGPWAVAPSTHGLRRQARSSSPRYSIASVSLMAPSGATRIAARS